MDTSRPVNAAPEMVSVGGLDLTCRASGAGMPVVLVHGFTGSQDDWMDHFGWFAEERRVVTYDHRGHGESTHAPPYTLDQLTADLGAVLDAFDLSSSVLLGHSMGGVVVQEFAIAHPERVRALILMDTWPGGRIRVGEEQENLFRMSAQVARQQGMEVLHELRGQLSDQLPQNSAGARLARERPEIAELNDRRFRSMDPEAYASLILEGLNGAVPDLMSGLRGLNVPILAIAGAEDEPFAEVLASYETELPDAEIVSIPGAGHSPQFETPGAWREVVGSFIGDLH